jgi:hypothetical protein
MRAFALVRDWERDIGAAATAGRAAVCLGGEVTVGEKSDVEGGQRERLTASSVAPPERLGEATLIASAVTSTSLWLLMTRMFPGVSQAHTGNVLNCRRQGGRSSTAADSVIPLRALGGLSH